MYYNIGEYTSALEYIQNYLKANDKNPAAFKVLGQCYEKLKRPDKQLAAYQRSLELDKKQPDLLVEVCKLLQNDDILGITPSKARYWYEMAEKRNIHHEAVLNLKLKYSNEESNDSFGDTVSSVQRILLNEIQRRPLDVGLRVRLVYQYLGQNEIDAAFDHVFDTELKQNRPFRNSGDWYSTASEVLAAYAKSHSDTINSDRSYWLLLISVYERQSFLNLIQSLNDQSSTDQTLLEATNSLYEFDQSLQRAVGANIFTDFERELSAQFYSHYGGQLCLHIASLLYKREINFTSRPNWQEAMKDTLPLLLLAYSCGGTDKDSVPLKKNTSENLKQLLNQWSIHSSFRMSQAGRTLQSCISTHTPSTSAVLTNLRKIGSYTDKYTLWSSQDDILNEIRSVVADRDWRKRLYQKVFPNKELHQAIGSSYLVKSRTLETPEYEWPAEADLLKFEEVSQFVEPSSLSHMVYLALGRENQHIWKDTSVHIDPELNCAVFKKLCFSVSNLLNCGAETLNQLDVETFLYATTIQAKRNVGISTVQNGNGPKILPYANMVNLLCSDEQADWWMAAYKVIHQISQGI